MTFLTVFVSQLWPPEDSGRPWTQSVTDLDFKWSSQNILGDVDK